MGGKSKQDGPPAYDPAMANLQSQQQAEMQNAMMMQMFQLQSSMMASQPQTPMLPPTPALNKEKTIDWGDRNKQLASKMKADYKVEQSRKKGRTDTILTSPMLDDEDTSTTKSLLSGGK